MIKSSISLIGPRFLFLVECRGFIPRAEQIYAAISEVVYDAMEEEKMSSVIAERNQYILQLIWAEQ